MNKKWIPLILKICVGLAAFVFIYYKISQRNDLSYITQLLSELSSKSFGSLIIVLALMGVNWALESKKWQFLASEIEPMSYINALKGTFSGVTLSVFTPNRIGEFVGRVFYISSGNRGKAIALSALGSFAQLCITFITGAGAFIFYLNLFTQIPNEHPLVYSGMSLFICVFILLIMAFYFYTPVFIKAITRLRFLKSFEKYILIIENLKFNFLLKILILSAIRYFVFSIQFYIVLSIFGVQLSLLNGFVVIALTYFAITAIPTIALSELGVRGSAALLFIGPLCDNDIAVVAASFVLWVINIATPALIGIPFLATQRFLNKV